MLYFVLCDYGSNGLAWAERDPTSMDFNSTVRDIREGHLSGVVKVLEVSEDGPVAFDRTEDVLRAAGRWSEPEPRNPMFAADRRRDYAKHGVA